MQCFLVGYSGICHLSLVFSLYTHSPYTENTSDKWHIQRYPTRKHCITSTDVFSGHPTILDLMITAGDLHFIFEYFPYHQCL